MQFRRAWVEENCSNSVLNIITIGYILPSRLKPKITRHPMIISEYKDQHKDLALASCIHCLLSKNATEKVSWVYIRIFTGTKTTTKMKTNHRPMQAKSIPEERKVQNGDPRINKDISKCRGMAGVNRPTGCLSPYPNSSRKST